MARGDNTLLFFVIAAGGAYLYFSGAFSGVGAQAAGVATGQGNGNAQGLLPAGSIPYGGQQLLNQGGGAGTNVPAQPANYNGYNQGGGSGGQQLAYNGGYGQGGGSQLAYNTGGQQSYGYA